MPLATLPGVLAEMSRTYKLMKRGKLDEETAKSAHLVSRQNATRRATIIRLSSQIEELYDAARLGGETNVSRDLGFL